MFLYPGVPDRVFIYLPLTREVAKPKVLTEGENAGKTTKWDGLSPGLLRRQPPRQRGPSREAAPTENQRRGVGAGAPDGPWGAGDIPLIRHLLHKCHLPPTGEKA